MGKIQFQGFLPLIFCAIVIAGLCFGQFIRPETAPCHAELCPEQCHPELVSGSHFLSSSHIGQYVKPLSQWDRLTMFNLQTRVPQFFNTLLMMQVEGESLKPKTPFWKQAGIYGLEFAGAGAGTTISLLCGLLFASEGGDVIDNPQRGAYIYVSGNMLFTSSCTWATGFILKQKGNWWKPAIGTGVGCLIGIPIAALLADKYPEGTMNGVALGILLSTPPLGAVIGYNLKKGE
jgi:hypothetical protein